MWVGYNGRWSNMGIGHNMTLSSRIVSSQSDSGHGEHGSGILHDELPEVALSVGEAVVAGHGDCGESEGMQGAVQEILVIVSTIIHTDGPRPQVRLDQWMSVAVSSGWPRGVRTALYVGKVGLWFSLSELSSDSSL